MTDAGIAGGAGSTFSNSGTLVKLGGSTARNLFYGSLFAADHVVNT
jgi:hypothetical protein